MGHRFQRAHDQGFTLIEMVISIALSAFIFAALAAVLAATVRTVAVAKARTQGNEIATAGIEDLQKLAYNNLGLCESPGPAQPGLTDLVPLSNCTPPPTDPCNGPASTAGAYVPRATYTCSRPGVSTVYTVRRYIAYGDVSHTEKRLAVFVTWEDQGGRHEVSQQSSLRIPSQNAVVGSEPPSLDSSTASVTPNPVPLTYGDPSNTTGTNSTVVTIQVVSTGLTATDSVTATYWVVINGNSEQASTQLASSDGVNWLGTLPANARTFGNGSQLFALSATRTSDGKTGSTVFSPGIQFGTTGPVVLSGATVPSSVPLDTAGGLIDPFTVSVPTQNLGPTDALNMVMNTKVGVVSVAMAPGAYVDGACTTTRCETTWTATVAPGSGHLFKNGAQPLYFQAIQGLAPPSVGATKSATSANVNFG